MPTTNSLKNYYPILLCFFITVIAKSQTPIIDQISTQQGLSQNTVRCILQDRKGFMWFGTINGLNRYDGYRFVIYKSEPGRPNTLSDNRIKDMYEDKNGFIWLKTYSNKFNCFDPVTETFQTFPRSIPSPDSDSTYDGFFLTRKGNIWLSSLRNGCAFVSYRKDHWFYKSLVNRKTDGSSLCNNRVNFIFEDSKENIWLCTSNGLSLVSGASVRNESFALKNYYPGKDIDFMLAFEQNNVLHFISRNKGVYSYDLRKNKFTKGEGIERTDVATSAALLSNHEILIATTAQGLLVYDSRTNRLDKANFTIDTRPEYISQIASDKNGAIWISNSTGNIWRLDSIARNIKKFKLLPEGLVNVVDNERFTVYTDIKKNQWITTYSGGLYCYNSHDGSMMHYKYEAGRSNVISSNYILSVFCDHSGTIWVGTEHTGINKFSFKENKFQTVYPSQNTELLSSNSVRAIFEDHSGTIWVSTKDGKLHLYDPGLKPITAAPVQKKLNFNSNVYCFFEDEKGCMWLGTKGEGIYYFNPQQTKTEITRFANDASNSLSLSNNQVYDIIQDNKNRIWVATFGGGLNLAEYDMEGRVSFKRFFDNERNFNQMRCLKLDKNGNIWAGTSNGVLRFNPDELIRNPESYHCYKSLFSQKNALSSNEVKDLYQDQHGQLWIGTSGGLNRYVPATSGSPEHFEVYSTKQGLSNDVIQGIMSDNEGNLWIGTESGISRYYPESNYFENFRLSENVLGNIISETACFRRKNGDMLWGSTNGFYSFNPKLFTAKQITKPVILTYFSISGNPVEINTPGSPLKKSITYTDKITLDNSQHSFSIEFATLLFNEQQRNQYSYILENYESEWNQLVNYNIATYKNLPPGKYIFKVKVSGTGNTKECQVTQLKITVLPPFWRSDIAMILYAVFFFLVFFSTKKVMERINRLQGVIELEKQLTDYKVKFFTNVSHEFRTPLFLIQGSMEAILESTKVQLNDKKHFQVMQRNVNRLLMLINQLLDFTKIQNKSMKLSLQETDVVDFMQGIYNSFTDLAEKKHIRFLFTTNVTNCMLYVDQAIVDKVAYNLLSNAFKFTPDYGKVDLILNVDSQEKKLTLTVKDTGTGIPKEKQELIFTRFAQIQPSTTGIGLSLARELTELNKGTIEFESTPGEGTTFTVTLPADPKLFVKENFAVSSEPADGRLPIVDMEEEGQPFGKELQALNSTKILVIEDNKEIRNYLTDYLGKYFRVDEAENGTEGLTRAVEGEPDLIVCDIMMPELNGIDLTKKLKSDFQTSHIPIILLTALASSDYQQQGAEAGADVYITKPFSIKFLLTRIIKLVEQREMLRKRYTSEIAMENNVAITHSDKDKEFLAKAYKIAEDNITNSEFSVDEFARLAGYGRTIFFKKIKGITGCSPNEYIRVVRMKRALELLQSGQFTVSEVSYKVGITDPFYFSRCFKAQFGHSPSMYLKKV